MAESPAVAPDAALHFSLGDCQRFSRLSGDVNPMHLDEVVARRLVAGRVVVHGSLVLLRALEQVAARHAPPIAGLSCEFANPVCVGDEATVVVQPGPVEDRVSVMVGAQVCAAIRLTRRAPDASLAEPDAAATVSGPAFGELAEPLSRPAEGWLGESGSVALSEADFAADFPATCAWIGVMAVRSIAAASYVVGMVCPGLHSIASSYRFTFHDAATVPSVLGFTVERYDARFQLFQLRLTGSVTGVAKAFVRPAPTEQPSVRELSALVGRGEFAGVRSLVVGASRGIGEATAKLLAAGGGSVVLTWAGGELDCQRVAADITAEGGQCTVVRFRAGTDDPAALLREIGPVDHAYYFPTPRIFRKAAGAFDRRRFDEFIDIYAGPFAALCEALNGQARPGTTRVFHPSSTAVAERPRGVTEYAMAKAAVELLAEDLDRTLQHITIIGTRLPRIATDQTATVFEVAAATAADVMLPIIRQMHAPVHAHGAADVSPAGARSS